MGTINRAPWTALVDDDGSNTTGSIWNKAAIKTVILDPADAAYLTPTSGTWTPTDGSGAGLTLTVSQAWFYKLGQVVTVWAQVTYPSTANGTGAKIAGLPHPNSVAQGSGSYSYGPAVLYNIPASVSAITLIDPVSLALKTNAQLSGATLIFSATYLAQ